MSPDQDIVDIDFEVVGRRRVYTRRAIWFSVFVALICEVAASNTLTTAAFIISVAVATFALPVLDHYFRYVDWVRAADIERTQRPKDGLFIEYSRLDKPIGVIPPARTFWTAALAALLIYITLRRPPDPEVDLLRGGAIVLAALIWPALRSVSAIYAGTRRGLALPGAPPREPIIQSWLNLVLVVGGFALYVWLGVSLQR